MNVTWWWHCWATHPFLSELKVGVYRVNDQVAKLPCLASLAVFFGSNTETGAPGLPNFSVKQLWRLLYWNLCDFGWSELLKSCTSCTYKLGATSLKSFVRWLPRWWWVVCRIDKMLWLSSKCGENGVHSEHPRVNGVDTYKGGWRGHSQHSGVVDMWAEYVVFGC